MEDVVVVGAGPAGLAAAATLRAVGISPVVLDRASMVGSSWRGRYDRLLLNSSRRTSHLPGMRFQKGPMWPTRDEVVAYLERYARAHRISPRFGVRVERVDPTGSAWTLATSDGELAARAVVIATGPDLEPVVPAWPGREAFAGALFHSSAYRNPEPFRGRDVLVVGGGESAGDIVMDLVDGGARRVWMSVRTPPYIFPERALGIGADWYALVGGRIPPRSADVFAAGARRFWIGDLSRYGLPAPRDGFFTAYRRGPVSAVIDRSGFVRALKARRFEVVPATERFEGGDVVLADGRRLRPDAVVAATGYRRGLEPVVGHLDGVLDASGRPRVHPPRANPPGLYLFGYTYSLPNLRWLRVDAKHLGRAVAEHARRAR